MIWLAALALLVMVLRTHHRIGELERNLLESRLQTAAMFENAMACDDALASMIDASQEPGEYTMSLN